MADSSGSLLCVVNYPANKGFAWDFIEGLYGRIADHLATHEIPTLVAYPAIPAPPRTLLVSAARTAARELESLEDPAAQTSPCTRNEPPANRPAS